MTTGHALLAFTAAAGLLTITPGLDTALVLRTAAVEGPKRAMLAACGICLGCLTWGVAAALGIGALLAVSHVAYQILRVAGACYLIYLGIGMLFRSRRNIPIFDRDLQSKSGNHPAWFVRGFMTNLLNPKVGVFYLTFLPQFVPAGAPVVSFSMLLATIHACEGIVWFWTMIHATRLFSAWFQRPRVTRSIEGVTGAVLTGFGLELLFERR